VGTLDGLVKVDTASALILGRVELREGAVQALSLDRHGSLWAGTPGGLVQINPVENRRVRTVTPLQGKGVFAMSFDPVGSIWVGTDTGLMRVNPYNGAVLGQVPNLPSNRVLALTPNTGNKIWVGTSEGLAWVSLSTYQTKPHWMFSRIYREIRSEDTEIKVEETMKLRRDR
jgi:ligand-binding sensor domain-containing protein